MPNLPLSTALPGGPHFSVRLYPYLHQERLLPRLRRLFRVRLHADPQTHHFLYRTSGTCVCFRAAIGLGVAAVLMTVWCVAGCS